MDRNGEIKMILQDFKGFSKKGHNHSNEKHARKFHSYFIVLTKTKSHERKRD